MRRGTTEVDMVVSYDGADSLHPAAIHVSIDLMFYHACFMLHAV